MDNRAASAPAEAGYPDPVFQAFAIKAASARARDRVSRAVRDVLGTGWRIEPYGGRRTSFEVLGDEGSLTAAEAWALSYRLRASRGILSAEPVFKAWVTDRKDWGADVDPDAVGDAVALEADLTTGIIDWLCGEGRDLENARSPEWSLEVARVVQAWANHFPGPDRRPGDGVVVGHPDTGYRNHPEIAGNLLPDRGYDLFRDDNDPTDELQDTFPWQNPGHGTGTASVIGSPRGPASGTAPRFVSGAAPGAGLIPFRVSDSVVVLDTLNLSRAIERAADAGAHVISISMGGAGSDRLHDAVVHARDKGAIVLAAAGNCVGFVVFPAAYSEVVAVAACDAELGIWKGSSRGPAVDVTAPGDRVWHAVANRNDGLANVGQGSGTSYAVATVAGVAALWLAKHGRNRIIQACGGREKVAPTFLQLLRATARTVPDWPAGRFGGGLVDADRLLAASLPDGSTVPTMSPTAADHATLDRGGGATFAHLFEASLRAGPGAAGDEPVHPLDRLDDRLAALLTTTRGKLPADLGQVGQELAFYLATDPMLHRRFAAAVASASPRPAAGDVEEVRQRLLATGVSPALGAKLRG